MSLVFALPLTPPLFQPIAGSWEFVFRKEVLAKSFGCLASTSGKQWTTSKASQARRSKLPVESFFYLCCMSMSLNPISNMKSSWPRLCAICAWSLWLYRDTNKKCQKKCTKNNLKWHEMTCSVPRFHCHHPNLQFRCHLRRSEARYTWPMVTTSLPSQSPGRDPDAFGVQGICQTGAEWCFRTHKNQGHFFLLKFRLRLIEPWLNLVPTWYLPSNRSQVVKRILFSANRTAFLEVEPFRHALHKTEAPLLQQWGQLHHCHQWAGWSFAPVDRISCYCTIGLTNDSDRRRGKEERSENYRKHKKTHGG